MLGESLIEAFYSQAAEDLPARVIPDIITLDTPTHREEPNMRRFLPAVLRTEGKRQKAKGKRKRRPATFALSLFTFAFLLLPFALGAERPVPPELLKGLEDKDAKVRIKAIKGLSKLGLEAVPPRLVKSLKDEETTVVNAATYALTLLRVEPKMLVESLQPHLKDNSISVRKGVTTALRKGGATAVPALEIALADKEVGVRKQAVLSLEVVVGRTPATAKEVLPALEKVIGDNSAAIRVDVARTLGRCGPEALAPTLKLADDEDWNVRAYALASLMRLKAPVAKVLPVLAKKAKDDPEVKVRQSRPLDPGQAGQGRDSRRDGAGGQADPAVQKRGFVQAAGRSVHQGHERGEAGNPRPERDGSEGGKRLRPQHRRRRPGAVGQRGRRGLAERAGSRRFNHAHGVPAIPRQEGQSAEKHGARPDQVAGGQRPGGSASWPLMCWG